MLNKKEKRNLLFLEIVEFILSILAIIVFTIIFRLEVRNIRYLFLLGDFYVIYSFAKTISSLEAKIEKKFAKTLDNKVSADGIEKLSV